MDFKFHSNMLLRLLFIAKMPGTAFFKSVGICDPFEQKQASGWVLTNPLYVTPLRSGSTFVDGFLKLIPQRIAVEISYVLVYCT